MLPFYLQWSLQIVWNDSYEQIIWNIIWCYLMWLFGSFSVCESGEKLLVSHNNCICGFEKVSSYLSSPFFFFYWSLSFGQQVLFCFLVLISSSSARPPPAHHAFLFFGERGWGGAKLKTLPTKKEATALKLEGRWSWKNTEIIAL